MENIEENKNIVSTLIKGLNVIKAFDRNNTHMTLSDVAKKVDITRASARRLLLTLEYLGYVNQRDTLFTLTPKIIELGYSYFASLPWTDLAYENMKKVSDTCNLSCSISILDGEQIICIMRVTANTIISEDIHVGTRLPTAYSATGRLFMAHMPKDKLENFINTLPLKQHTKQSITDNKKLYKTMLASSEQPYQIVVEELENGLIAMAVPIYNRNKELIGAMNVGAHIGSHSASFLKENVLPILQKAAQDTSKAISSLQY